MPSPGEIYFVYDLFGVEPHRAVVVSREDLNKGKYVLAVPFTSKQFDVRKNLPNCVPYTAGQFGFTKDCVARGDQITFVDQEKLDFDSGVIGKLGDDEMRDVIRAIGYAVSAECEPE